MPSLLTCNCFQVLANISNSKTSSDVQKIEETPAPFSTPTPLLPKVRKPKWEKGLPEKFIIAAMEGTPNSLKFKMQVEIDTAEKRSITALVDSGATGEFIDRQYAKSCQFKLMKLTQPILVYNIDGYPNEAGLIIEVVSLLLCYNNHSEQTTFCIANLGKQKLLLGHSWLCKHNPEIDWVKGEVKMSRCPPHCCSRCQDKLCQERIAHKKDINLFYQTPAWIRSPLVMFFGLTNSPATFQTMMDRIFEDLISEGIVVVYLDNILIFTKTLDEHWRVVCQVMELLQQHGLSLKPEKCKFEKTSVEYLGVAASQDSVKIDPAKVARVAEWPTPSNKKEVQLFLGFTNFYWRFIEGFSYIAQPLFDLTKANSMFKWSSEEKLVFDTLKDQITSALILALPDNSRPYHIEADSSDFGTRAVLSQQNLGDNKWHPIAF